jgi:hypothetical protein
VVAVAMRSGGSLQPLGLDPPPLWSIRTARPRATTAGLYPRRYHRRRWQRGGPRCLASPGWTAADSTRCQAQWRLPSPLAVPFLGINRHGLRSIGDWREEPPSTKTVWLPRKFHCRRCTALCPSTVRERERIRTPHGDKAALTWG